VGFRFAVQEPLDSGTRPHVAERGRLRLFSDKWSLSSLPKHIPAAMELLQAGVGLSLIAIWLRTDKA
jgi:hypothetical protein